MTTAGIPTDEEVIEVFQTCGLNSCQSRSDVAYAGLVTVNGRQVMAINARCWSHYEASAQASRAELATTALRTAHPALHLLLEHWPRPVLMRENP